MTDIDIDADDFDVASGKVELLSETIDNTRENLERDLADDLRDDIIGQVLNTFENEPDDKEQVALKDSFYTLNTSFSSLVVGDAPHAKPLEEGVPPHDIEPNDAGALSFFPENQGEYPPYVRNEDGSVTFNNSVSWKPKERPDGYGYVSKAQRFWASYDLKKDLPIAIRLSIRAAGFNRR